MNPRSHCMTRETAMLRRKGVVLAAALIAFAVVTATLFAILKGVASQHHELQREMQVVQADYLADAGLQRALTQLQRDSSYHGETWRLSEDEFDGVTSGTVLIEVNRSSGNDAAITIRSQADYPNDEIHRIRKTREITISGDVR
jgi:type II secretory pathway component PulK